MKIKHKEMVSKMFRPATVLSFVFIISIIISAVFPQKILADHDYDTHNFCNSLEFYEVSEAGKTLSPVNDVYEVSPGAVIEVKFKYHGHTKEQNYSWVEVFRTHAIDLDDAGEAKYLGQTQTKNFEFVGIDVHKPDLSWDAQDHAAELDL